MTIFKKYEKYFVVFGAFILQFSIGNLYTYNNVSSYLIKFMNSTNLSHGSVSEKNAIWIFSLSVFGLGSSVTLGGIISRKIGPSLTVLLGGWFMSLNVLLMSYTITTYLAVVIISYGFCTGVGSGIVYGVTIGTVCQWFPKKTGLITGIVVAGFGLSSVLVDLLQISVIKLDSNLNNVPFSYIVTGSIFIVLQFFGSLFLTNPQEMEKSQDISPMSDTDSMLRTYPFDNETSEISVKPHEIYLELDYWIMWITYALLSCCFTLIISLTKDFGSHLKIGKIPNREISYLSIASILGALFNACGRIVWGYLIDKFRYKVLMLIMTLSLTVFFGSFYFCTFISQAYNTENDPHTLAYYFIWIIFLYFIPSGIFSIFPQVCSKLFGTKYLIGNYGMLFTAYSVGGLITGVIVTLTSEMEFVGACVAGTVMAFVAALVTLAYRGKSLVHRNILFS